MSLFVGRVIGTKRGQPYQYTDFQATVKSALLISGFTIPNIPCFIETMESIYQE